MLNYHHGWASLHHIGQLEPHCRTKYCHVVIEDLLSSKSRIQMESSLISKYRNLKMQYL